MSLQGVWVGLYGLCVFQSDRIKEDALFFSYAWSRGQSSIVDVLFLDAWASVSFLMFVF
jgi:hypothetical protein